MALPKAALKKVTKEEITNLTIAYQVRFIQDFKSMKRDLSQLRQKFSKFEFQLAVTK